MQFSNQPLYLARHDYLELVKHHIETVMSEILRDRKAQNEAEHFDMNRNCVPKILSLPNPFVWLNTKASFIIICRKCEIAMVNKPN